MNPKDDLRNIENGYEIPKENYCDQPYVVVRQDGAWVVCLTTGRGAEGHKGQHIISAISYDKGKSWSKPVDIEPADGPESSWVMPFMTDYGRIYVFYVYNKDNMRTVHSKVEPGYITRVDTLGAMAFKYSDDGGESWSKDRYYIPIRNFTVDDNNPYGGKVQFFWGVGKPILHKNAMYLGFSKVGVFGEAFMEDDEGAFLRCPNINTEKDPNALIWETLPDGKEGIRSPLGNVADEHNLVSLSDGSLFCTFRTIAGHNGQSYSRDDGKTWDKGEFMKTGPNGRLLKHPRAANFVRKYSNGKYTLWFHNHGRKLLHDPGKGYLGRNPAWMCGGVEKDGYIYWSQPEIILYSRDCDERMSYPDFIEDGGEFYITETQKTIARTHKVDKSILEAMWNHLDNDKLSTNGLIFEVTNFSGDSKPIPQVINLEEGDGFAIQMILDLSKTEYGCLLDGRDALNQGIFLEYTYENTVRLHLIDGQHHTCWDSDVLTSDMPHISVIVDGCSGIISFVVDGLFCDGGEKRDYGFGRIDTKMKDVAGKGFFTLGKAASEIKLLRFYDRYILTAEAVGNYRYDLNNGMI
ncbi:MAG: sialidase family protein [Acutalibacteraceae bacterium]|jgi:hypothetical protein